MQRKERKTNKNLRFGMYCFTLLLHLIEKTAYNQVTYVHVNLLLEEKRFFKTKNGASHAPPLIRQNRLD